MIYQYVTDTFPDRKLPPTTGVKNWYKVVDAPRGGEDGKPLKIRLDIWDTAGSETNLDIYRNFYTGSHAVIVVYAVDCYSSFK